MPSLPIVPIQVALNINVGSLDSDRASQLLTFGPKGKGNGLRGSKMVSQNQQKTRGSQWYAQSVHCVHTVHAKGKCGKCGS